MLWRRVALHQLSLECVAAQKNNVRGGRRVEYNDRVRVLRWVQQGLSIVPVYNRSKSIVETMKEKASKRSCQSCFMITFILSSNNPRVPQKRRVLLCLGSRDKSLGTTSEPIVSFYWYCTVIIKMCYGVKRHIMILTACMFLWMVMPSQLYRVLVLAYYFSSYRMMTDVSAHTCKLRRKRRKARSPSNRFRIQPIQFVLCTESSLFLSFYLSLTHAHSLSHRTFRPRRSNNI